jgi:hypothetical protein
MRVGVEQLQAEDIAVERQRTSALGHRQVNRAEAGLARRKARQRT